MMVILLMLKVLTSFYSYSSIVSFVLELAFLENHVQILLDSPF